MEIEVDEDGETLTVNGTTFDADSEGVFEVLAFHLQNDSLKELPVGLKVRLVNRVIGSRETFISGPSCTFERLSEDNWLVHTNTAFLLEDERIAQGDLTAYFEEALVKARAYLTKLEQNGRVLNVRDSIYDDIAYVEYSLRLEEQTFAEAQAFVEAIEERLHEDIDRPLLFVCHASEDTAFAQQLVSALDRRALYAWYDKRDVLVGESIVARIEEALGQVRYVVALLSRSSVNKPWVRRELHSTMMRQLAGRGVQILPALLDDCEIPALLADVKYADFRNSFEAGYSDLLSAIRRPPRGRTA
jgi:TIR domain